MKTHIFPVTFFFTCILFLLGSEVVYGKKLYKVIDESGKTSFSDQVSPEETKYRRETLDKQGTVIDVTDKEKTREQQARENMLNQLRKKQEKIIQNQKAHDDSLLRSYHTKEDMITEMNAKIQVVDAQKKLMESEITQQLERLDIKQKSAATYERNAKPIPPNLIEEIKTIQNEIAASKKSIDENLVLQKKISDEYDINIKRFLVLTKPPEDEQSDKISSIEEANALGLFRCENDFQCKKAWEIARLFVDANSTTPPDVITEKLVMHALPAKDTDISLSISKIATKDAEDQLFLDIHCRESSVGKDLCKSPKIQELRSSFRPYVNERLSNKVPTP
jgi:hypothetical protein